MYIRTYMYVYIYVYVYIIDVYFGSGDRVNTCINHTCIYAHVHTYIYTDVYMYIIDIYLGQEAESALASIWA